MYYFLLHLQKNIRFYHLAMVRTHIWGFQY
jgi:hypothetical protein